VNQYSEEILLSSYIMLYGRTVRRSCSNKKLAGSGYGRTQLN